MAKTEKYPGKRKRAVRSFRAAPDVQDVIDLASASGVDISELINDAVRDAAPKLLERYSERIKRASGQAESRRKEES